MTACLASHCSSPFFANANFLFDLNVNLNFSFPFDYRSGQFAVVKRCKDKSTGAEFAAKFLKRKRGKRERKGVTAEQIANEANVLRKVRHDGIIYLHDVFETSTQFTLILEL